MRYFKTIKSMHCFVYMYIASIVVRVLYVILYERKKPCPHYRSKIIIIIMKNVVRAGVFPLACLRKTFLPCFEKINDTIFFMTAHDHQSMTLKSFPNCYCGISHYKKLCRPPGQNINVVNFVMVGDSYKLKAYFFE